MSADSYLTRRVNCRYIWRINAVVSVAWATLVCSLAPSLNASPFKETPLPTPCELCRRTADAFRSTLHLIILNHPYSALVYKEQLSIENWHGCNYYRLRLCYCNISEDIFWHHRINSLYYHRKVLRGASII